MQKCKEEVSRTAKLKTKSENKRFLESHEIYIKNLSVKLIDGFKESGRLLIELVYFFQVEIIN